MSSDFYFKNGSFVPSPSSIPRGADGEDVQDTFAAAGFYPSQTVGDESGLHYVLYERSGSDPAWIVLFGTACRYCAVFCSTWPDLLDLLAKLSPIVLSAVLSGDHLDAIYELLGPTMRALRNRRK